MKTYHMYHTESISAESKLKDAEKQEEKQFSKSGDLNVNLLRHDDRPPRRSSARKIEKMKEKVSAPRARHQHAGGTRWAHGGHAISTPSHRLPVVETERWERLMPLV